MDPVNDARSDERREKGDASGERAAQLTTPRSVLGYTVLALGLALFIRFFIAAPYVVSGASMEPTFDDWNYLIIDKLVYDVREPQRGDVIVFELPQDTARSLIKRVIGLPGETVLIEGSQVTIKNTAHPDGFSINEPYIDPANASVSDRLQVVLAADEYFVLGDNRRVSADSRLWGKLPRADITGRVDARLFPFSAMEILPGEARYNE